MEHNVTFESEVLMDQGVPVDQLGNPTSFVSRQHTGRATCTCGWEGENKEVQAHFEWVVEERRKQHLETSMGEEW